MRRIGRVVGIALVAAWSGAGGWAEMIYESARDIPVAYDVDVVVVGGSLGAVAAAVEAAQNGASVFLAAPRPYLGEDVCAAYRLWLEPGEHPASPLAQALFTPPRAPVSMGKGVPFTYETDPPSAEQHKDTTPPSVLSDGETDNAQHNSVQYDGDVTVVLDLGKEIPLGRVHLLAFQRAKDFELEHADVWLSKDKQHWDRAATMRNEFLGKGGYETSPLVLSTELTGQARYIKLEARKSANAKRILLAEIVVEPQTSPNAPQPVSASDRVPPMPMQIKRTLDEALIAAGVPFLYGCFATEILRDATGNPAGMVMANRSGRQAVKAKVIIDATARASVARMAGAAFRRYSSKPQTFQRVVVGGRVPDAEGVLARERPAPVQIEQGGWSERVLRPAFEYTLKIPMRDGSFSAFAEAEQTARDKTWNPDQVAASEAIFQVPPDAVRGKKHGSGAWPETDQVNLDAFKPARVDRLFVLGGCADVSRKAAARLLRPLALLDLGARIGRAAATEARALPKAGTVRVAAAKSDAPVVGDVCEVLVGVRPTQSNLPAVHSEAHGLPVFGTYDVVVVGGGTAGAPAGIAAARHGAKTLVIEYLDGLGGVGTLGLIGSYYYGFREGFTAEIDKGVADMGTTKPQNPHQWNVEGKMEWYRRELRKAGAKIWFGALACGAVVDNGRVKGVVVATSEGRGVVLAKAVIDATGNANIAAAAGAPCDTTGAAHVAVQGTGMPPRKPGENYTNTDYTFTDDSDAVDAWRTFVAGRNKYKDSFDLIEIVDSRERRRIVGEFVISPLDIWNHRTYPDSVGLSSSNFDTHGFTIHALFALQPPGKDAVSAYTPFRSLIPKGLDGILVTGLGISAHRDAMPILRMQPDIQNQGYAAGVAAAMAAHAGVGLRAIDIKALQKELVEKGNLPASVLTDVDSYPFSMDQIRDAVTRLANHYDGVSVVLTQPDDAVPLLRKAYADARETEPRLIYAHVLGMLGDPAGAATLAEAVAGAPWDDGWSFTGMGQFGMSLSHVDSLIIALGRTRDPQALKPILEKASTLDAQSDLSHHRAVAIALETLGRTEASTVLADLLRKPEMAGYACTDIETAKRNAAQPNPNLDRDRSLRELILARALYRCGDIDAVGKGILKQYEQDLRGHFARHAHAILEAESQKGQRESGQSRRLDIENR